MERLLVLYDRDENYSERFSRYLSCHTEHPLSVYHFHDLGSLQSFADNNRIDMLVSSEGLTEELKHQLHAGRFIRLSEDVEDRIKKQEGVVYKYQSGEQIVREIMGMSEKKMPSQHRQKPAKTYMVFSPIGRTGKSTFARALAAVLADIGSVLLLSFEEMTCENAEDGNGCLSEALYYYREKVLDKERLAGLIRKGDRYDRILPVRLPEDIAAFSGKELRDFAELIEQISGYEFLVIDTDGIVSRFGRMMMQAEMVFMPVTERPEDHQRIIAFENYLSTSRMEQILKKTVRLLVPEEEKIPGGTTGGTRLRIFTEAVIKNYIAKDREAMDGRN